MKNKRGSVEDRSNTQNLSGGGLRGSAAGCLKPGVQIPYSSLSLEEFSTLAVPTFREPQNSFYSCVLIWYLPLSMLYRTVTLTLPPFIRSHQNSSIVVPMFLARAILTKSAPTTRSIKPMPIDL
jgi:hypothetical protein